MRGNDARFINHGCEPNLEVKRYQTLGDGLEEYEIGMWAMKDIAQGEEVSRASPIIAMELISAILQLQL